MLGPTTENPERPGSRAMAPYNFDDRNIKWNTLALPPAGEVKHVLFTILNVDEENHIVHVLFKFSANEKIILPAHDTQQHVRRAGRASALRARWYTQGDPSHRHVQVHPARRCPSRRRRPRPGRGRVF